MYLDLLNYHPVLVSFQMPRARMWATVSSMMFRGTSVVGNSGTFWWSFALKLFMSFTHHQVGDICHQGDYSSNYQIYSQRYPGYCCYISARLPNAHFSFSVQFSTASQNGPLAQVAPFLLTVNSIGLGVLCCRGLSADGRQTALEQKFYTAMHMTATSAVAVPVIYLLGVKYGRRVS